jgi:hypothetical protein
MGPQWGINRCGVQESCRESFLPREVLFFGTWVHFGSSHEGGRRHEQRVTAMIASLPGVECRLPVYKQPILQTAPNLKCWF